MPARNDNNPKRRIVPSASVDRQYLAELAERARYGGSPHHKSRPADYDFHPPQSPRPHKSLCDAKRVVLKEEAESLLKKGIMLGMVSKVYANDFPKYIWAVDDHGEPYEAKLGHDGRRYHGYQLGQEDSMRQVVIKEWKKRCETA